MDAVLSFDEFFLTVFFPEGATLLVRKLVTHIFKKQPIYKPREGKIL